MSDYLADLRARAEAATSCETYAGPWSWVDRPAPDKAQRHEVLVGSESDMGTIADVVPWAPELAAHIATFDPPTVLALLDVAQAAKRSRDWHDENRARGSTSSEDCRDLGRRLRELDAALARLRTLTGEPVAARYGESAR